MDEQCPETEPDSKLQPVDPARHFDDTLRDDEQSDRLLEMLDQWEVRFFLAGEPAPQSLGVDDPLLLAALMQRIEERKRLYESIGLTTQTGSVVADGQEKASAGSEKSSAPTVRSHGNDQTDSSPPAQADPASIGRYRLIRILGKGAFGRVYLARDSVLDRLVAIKVPVTNRAAEFIDVKTYRDEARILSQLSHPNIVPVYDVGETSECPFFVVSKYIDGGDLSARLARGRPAFAESAELVAVTCDALHYSHTHDLFHRDIKPANILIDSAGVPYLADFGLALKDENFGTGARFVGTVAYTSPEQARGEGHLVDGRSDIFSLGIVFYEMLTCRRPFRGDSHQKIMQQIIGSEPRPPRQIDDTIPKELERICMKALSKRASERYTTARDMAEDLRHFLKTASDEGLSQALSSAPAASLALAPAEAASTTTWARSDLSAGPLRIIPKGLGSFDEHDADFFLELLPGPRDREGLPDGLRFWKTRIEATDPDKTFRVGMIYGPSGSGKSSLVKAGLLPLLGKHVTPVYLEATTGETVTRLLRGIKKEVPGLPEDAGLVDSFLALRRGHYLRPGRKMLVVLDQFEQWLFARRHDQGDELVAALRQCDGEKIQVLCLVRDDFWMAATRFSRDVEIDLVPDRNIAAVDLFEPKHARKVLAAFGRAYEALPPGAGDLAKDQRAFLDQAIAALARDGQVVPVRLALFAEMVKGKPWTPATLREVGGTDGVGVKFLEETFSSPRSSPRYRYHVNAVQSVFQSLLSETSPDIKGRMRSIEELRDVSGYAEKPGEFSDLIRILDNDLRLITPVDLESSLEKFVPANLAAGGRYYQLTHDYLVRPLRDWLNRKQRETRRGRAELLLTERAALWNTKPERLHLPSAREWLWIRLLTRRTDWTAAQKRMMTRAARVHGVRLVGFFAVVALLAGLGAAYGVYVQTNQLLISLSRVEVDRIPQVLGQLKRYPHWAYKGRLRELAMQPDVDPRTQTAYGLALLYDDPGQIHNLFNRLLSSDHAEMTVIRDGLFPFRAQISDTYRNELGHALLRTTDSQTFSILFPLIDEHNAVFLADLRKAVDEPIAAADKEEVKDEIAARRARAAAALIRLGQANQVWHLLEHSPDPRTRSALINALNPLGADPAILADELHNVEKSVGTVPLKEGSSGEKNSYLFDRETSRRRGLILALAAYPPAQLESSRRERLVSLLEDLYQNDPDAGVHSAAELVLSRFGRAKLPEVEKQPLLPGIDFQHRWYVTQGGHTMVKLDGPVEFRMGSPISEPERQKHEVLHRRIIPWRFAIGSREVTVDQFQRYAQEKRGSLHEFNKHYSPESDGPVISVSWFDAVQYCNWLSDKEGLPRCYLPNDRGEFAEGIRIDLEAVAQGGYRLPTDAEWELACRAGTLTSRYYGYAPDLLGHYEWYIATSGFHARSCGKLLPNELGLFDMLGNVSEWCHDRHPEQLPRLNEVVSDVIAAEVATNEKRNIRGETYAMIPAGLRSAAYAWNDPTENRPDIGFRPARTIP